VNDASQPNQAPCMSITSRILLAAFPSCAQDRDESRLSPRTTTPAHPLQLQARSLLRRPHTDSDRPLGPAVERKKERLTPRSAPSSPPRLYPSRSMPVGRLGKRSGCIYSICSKTSSDMRLWRGGMPGIGRLGGIVMGSVVEEREDHWRGRSTSMDTRQPFEGG